ncbi:hypothetical protein PHYBLDRAFT_170021 [Phycomyces blakesleeanus NRRL 1555(-)]|uniref:Uncharacterized protein n=1 Tax=Phycomyces blakesleeanus (strain ATCC 8743b / DSM 1359 / FGSC 10004 / NBRC 33097 / NRRL 1555) TaxID=763407 RepID=A0A167M8L6_PHYB8|nr:hypothetical protein PHYBLDRAFT_170021 [Phycomyces blakesleeanus NRRL 1555(-)]OAD72127.1 hypothetical protein PHYBLDRAFT_170021 [Phycomyces blakesleeanus NRRL 1555(-)]|eukprot:XP_018290167.1 hypothetical protein PHYBLDRAFT_170021 [Phycomyces blakesleeanus NRRL 1555(-)]
MKETHSLSHSDVPSSQQSSGLARVNEHPSYERAIPQELPSHATVIAMIISWSAKKSFAFVKEIIIPCFTVNVLFLCPFVLGTSNKIFHPKYNKLAEQEVAEDIE